jgi:hypothetical protein
MLSLLYLPASRSEHLGLRWSTHPVLDSDYTGSAESVQSTESIRISVILGLS